MNSHVIRMNMFLQGGQEQLLPGQAYVCLVWFIIPTELCEEDRGGAAVRACMRARACVRVCVRVCVCVI